MPLHHRQNLDDMRYAYARSNKSRQSDDSESGRSYESGSAGSYLTQPTEYSSSPAKRPPHLHHNTSESRHSEPTARFFDDRVFQESPRASVATYASTVQSEEEVEDEIPDYDPPEYEEESRHGSSVLAATPADFSELFPSRRRLQIHHDDTTLDGNMNLRVDTEVHSQGRKCDMTLFHLRMHDLKNREFSLRRYCRDSGREVCHTARKQQKPATPKRPSFQRSLSNALSSMRPKSESRTPTLDSLKRNDSGYGSTHSVDFDEDARPPSSGQGAASTASPANDTIRLEFSNYAQVDVKRCGVKGNKRYEFEYWGAKFAWRRHVRKEDGIKEIEYRLHRQGSEHALAHIVPAALSVARHEEEQSKGGWIAPSSMWLSDDSLVRGQKDAVDVVIASALIALVDDQIRQRFQSKTSKQILIPKMQYGVEYVGPKRLINEMFRRDSDSSQPSRPSTSRRPTSSGHAISTGSRPATASVRQSSYER